MFVIDEETLGLKYELDECSYGTGNVWVYAACSNSYNELLKIAMFSAHALFEFRDAICPMAFTNTWLEHSHLSIQFVTAHDIDDPFQNVIETKFMPLVQGIWC